MNHANPTPLAAVSAVVRHDGVSVVLEVMAAHCASEEVQQNSLVRAERCEPSPLQILTQMARRWDVTDPHGGGRAHSGSRSRAAREYGSRAAARSPFRLVLARGEVPPTAARAGLRRLSALFPPVAGRAAKHLRQQRRAGGYRLRTGEPTVRGARGLGRGWLWGSGGGWGWGWSGC